MQQTLTSLLAALTPLPSFEEAATTTLRRMLEVAGRALAASSLSGRGALLRGMVHIRPTDGYRRLVVLEAGTKEVAPVSSTSAKEGPERAANLPSATAWRWVAQHGCAVSIDVHAGKVHVHDTEAPLAVRDGRLQGGAFNSQESAQRLLARAASHLYVLPLRSPGGGVDGMISLEADCQAAIGREFIWPACADDLRLIADLAAPYLATLPSAAPAAASTDDLLPVVGSAMSGIVQMARVFAEQEETLLIGGPTGAGKSRLARWCHARSRRHAHKFEALDLMTVPEELQMGELFGWKKGAFSGAVTDTPGCIARVDGGSLFIDEIDKLSLKAQAGLLQVLEERRYRPLGEGSGERRANVRFLVGSNADLRAAVRAGRFREDLYYRINVLPVQVPALDERTDEIAAWAGYMLERRHRESVPEGSGRLEDGATRMLLQSRWPGNLRQLDNIVRRAYALALIDAPGLPREIVLGERHVARALGYEAAAEVPMLIGLLERAAAAFVAEAEKRAGQERPLDLDLADAFRGFVVGTAARKLQGKDAAVRLLGQAGAGPHRHRPSFRHELEKVALLCREVGHAGTMPFSDLLADEPAWTGEPDGAAALGAEAAAEHDRGSDVPEVARSAIEAALAQARGSVTTAARQLGLKNRFVLYRLMKRHGIAVPEGEPSAG